MINPLTGQTLNTNPEGCNQYRKCPMGQQRLSIKKQAKRAHYSAMADILDEPTPPLLAGGESTETILGSTHKASRSGPSDLAKEYKILAREMDYYGRRFTKDPRSEGMERRKKTGAEYTRRAKHYKSAQDLLSALHRYDR